MKFSVLTAFPQMIQESLAWGVVGKARDKGLFSCEMINPRDFTTDVHKTIDDRPFGGGDGMVMLYEPLAKAMEAGVDLKTSRKIYLSPAGRRLDDALVKELAQQKHITLMCGRYGGVDQRFLNHYQFENISVGDYVVSGGELPALMLMDAVIRKLPGALGNEASAQADSFAQGPFFEAPLFTRPSENIAGKVPAVFLSGDHKKIDEFRFLIGQILTYQQRPEVGELMDFVKIKKFLKTLSREDLAAVGVQDRMVSVLLGDDDGKK